MRKAIFITGTLALAVIAGSTTTFAAPASQGHSATGAKWTSPYADGTGNSKVDDLNNAQLNQNYKGPYYHKGQSVPPARATDLSASPSGATTMTMTGAPKAGASGANTTGSMSSGNGQAALPPPQPMTH